MSLHTRLFNDNNLDVMNTPIPEAAGHTAENLYNPPESLETAIECVLNMLTGDSEPGALEAKCASAKQELSREIDLLHNALYERDKSSEWYYVRQWARADLNTINGEIGSVLRACRKSQAVSKESDHLDNIRQQVGKSANVAVSKARERLRELGDRQLVEKEVQAAQTLYHGSSQTASARLESELKDGEVEDVDESTSSGSEE